MKFDFIVGRRSASSVGNARNVNADRPGSPGVGRESLADGFTDSSLPSPIQDGQFFIAQNGGVYRRNFKEGDQEVLLPNHVAARDDGKLADSRRRREALTCLKLLIQMRDLKHRVLEVKADAALMAEWKEDLLNKYKGFVQAFGPLNRKDRPAADSSGWINPYHYQSAIKEFRNSPDGAYVANLEIYDPASRTVSLGALLSEIRPSRTGLDLEVV